MMVQHQCPKLHQPLVDNHAHVESGNSLPVLSVSEADDSDTHTTASIPSLVVLLFEHGFEYGNRFQDDTVRGGGDNRRNN